MLRYKNLATGQGVRGIIIARFITDDLKLAASETKDIELFEYDLKMDMRIRRDFFKICIFRMTSF